MTKTTTIKKGTLAYCEQIIDKMLRETGLIDLCEGVDEHTRYAGLVAAMLANQDATMQSCLSAYAIVRRIRDLEQAGREERTVAA